MMSKFFNASFGSWFFLRSGSLQFSCLLHRSTQTTYLCALFFLESTLISNVLIKISYLVLNFFNLILFVVVSIYEFFIMDLLMLIFLLVGVLLSVAFFTLLERKVMASSQRRKGPDVVGFWGILQPIADGLKLVIKESVIPYPASSFLFFVAALLPFVMAFSAWIFLPLSSAPLADISAGLPLLLAFSSIGVYGIIFSGWSSNSKYAFLGGLRSAAQVISYELVLGFSYLCVVLLSGSMNLVSIVYAQQSIWYLIPLLPVAVMFLIAMLAETNRTPFDLPEAEAELVAGYNVEYSSLLFAFFFLAEYANMLLMSVIFSLLFLGGWLPLSLGFFVVPGWIMFTIKVLLVAIFFVLVRSALPRVRYDQLMLFSWKVLLPLEFGLFFLYVGLVYWLEMNEYFFIENADGLDALVRDLREDLLETYYLY